ncbi:MAG: aldo/keto reductase [Alphaproteobacteria bacterium]|nr:aldo/keto reductase [Alphaproteobacteria bacterium]
MIAAPSIDLRSDYRISKIIKGGWQLAGDHGAVDRAAAIRDMAAFVDAGITTFDCADIYRGVEEMIGAFLQDLRRRRGADAANRVRVHTKFVPDANALTATDRRQVEPGIDRSLTRLGVERLDLVQFHWWDYGVPGALDVIGHLQELRDKGKIRHLGLTNFDLDHTRRFIEAGIDLLSVQVQFSLIDRRPSGDFADFCRTHDIAIFAYGVLAGGFFSDRWLGVADPGYAFENRSLIKYRLIIDEFGGWGLFQELLTVLAAIAARHGVSLVNVALRAMIDHSELTAVILGARYAHHLQDNLRALAFMPSDADQAALAAVLAKRHGPSGPVFGLERDRTTRHGQIFKKNLNADPSDAPTAS